MFKACNKCGEHKAISEFKKSKTGKHGVTAICKPCETVRTRELRLNDYFNKYVITKRAECRKKGIQFDLTGDYLESLWTGYCPILNLQITYGGREGKTGSSYSAHLDRLDPSKGYVVGNVNWVSGRANRIKYDATIEELEAIVKWMERVTTS